MNWWLREFSLPEALHKIGQRVLPNIRYLPRSRIRICGACQSLTLIVALGSDEEFHLCLRCRANLRYEMLARYLRRAFPEISRADVLELDYRSPLRRYLSNARTYMRSFYRDDAAPGTLREDGAVCQDITRLTLRDKTLDLIVSSDVLEHVNDATAAFRESARVLRAGGAHIFTVPPRPATRRRATVENGRIVHLTTPEYHLDPLSSDGILAFWDYGPDLSSVFATTGLRFSIASGPEGSSGRIVWEARKV